jgi:hypothetical protein
MGLELCLVDSNSLRLCPMDSGKPVVRYDAQI